ncbi:MAG: hypothetical protein ACYC9N_19300 [Thermoanaerobaculia bacterium]
MNAGTRDDDETETYDRNRRDRHAAGESGSKEHCHEKQCGRSADHRAMIHPGKTGRVSELAVSELIFGHERGYRAHA